MHRGQTRPLRRILGLALLCAASLCGAQDAAQSRVLLVPLADSLALTAAGSNKVLVLQDRDVVLTMEHDSRRIYLNGVQVWLNGSIRMAEHGAWTIQGADWQGTLQPLLKPAIGLIPSQPLILIDPGHGGSDSGAQSKNKKLEKNITLSIAKTLRKKLAACQIHAELTRDNDTALTLSNRTEQVVGRHAALFVSIHLNHAQNIAATGVETYVLPEPGFQSSTGTVRPTDACPGNRFDDASIFLAYCVQKGVLAKTAAPDRGIRRARYEVLKEASCPAVLVECGFLSNVDEANRLTSAAYQEAIAEGILRGLLTCISRLSPNP